MRNYINFMILQCHLIKNIDFYLLDFEEIHQIKVFMVNALLMEIHQILFYTKF